MKDAHIMLRNKAWNPFKRYSKRGFQEFLENMPNLFVFKIILEERKRKRDFGKRLEKCPFGRVLGI